MDLTCDSIHQFMVKNCQLQFDDLSISKLLEVDRLLSMFSGSMYRD